MGATALIIIFPIISYLFVFFKFPRTNSIICTNSSKNKMKSSLVSHAILLQSLLIFLYLTTTCQATSNNIYTQFIRDSCNTTLYPQLCYKTLSKFADKIQASPKLLANTSIFVAQKEAKSTFMVLKNLSRCKDLSIGERAALRDCVEVTDDSVYELRRSMDQMDHMDDGGPSFVFEISNVETWVSAALTYYTTCMDGFASVSEGNVKEKVSKYVLNVAHLTSIALAFINKYADLG